MGDGNGVEQSAHVPSSGRPTSAAMRLRKHSSSGNVMLDQLLKDLGNKLTVAEDVSVFVCVFLCGLFAVLQTSSNKSPLKGVQLASAEDILHKNWLSTCVFSILYVHLHMVYVSRVSLYMTTPHRDA